MIHLAASRSMVVATAILVVEQHKVLDEDGDRGRIRQGRTPDSDVATWHDNHHRLIPAGKLR